MATRFVRSTAMVMKYFYLRLSVLCGGILHPSVHSVSEITGVAILDGHVVQEKANVVASELLGRGSGGG